MGENRSSRRSLRFFAVCLAMAAAMALVQPVLLTADRQAYGAEAQDRKPFVIASQRNAPPFSFADKDGEPQGILVEFWRLWAARNGHEITFQLDDLDETIEAVRKGRPTSTPAFSIRTPAAPISTSRRGLSTTPCRFSSWTSSTFTPYRIWPPRPSSSA